MKTTQTNPLAAPKPTLNWIPNSLQQRMSDYFQTTWSLNHGIDTYEVKWTLDAAREQCGLGGL